mmetsp:Transcript_92002/g.126854  ORF Transcript_92002/g.126854 Transcript_92002/m.126854 type:complete len:107 (+) Transcript_92002:120-440(+)
MSKEIFNIAIPVIGYTMLNMMLYTSWYVTLGTLENNLEMMAGAGLGLSITYAFVDAPLLGINSAIGVLVSIAYGKQDHCKCELILSRGRMLVFLFSIPFVYISVTC